MKKVGLVTLYEADNFGTCLQAFALQKTIKDLGYVCDIIRFDRNIASPHTSKIETIKRLGVRKTLDIFLSKRTIGAQKKEFAGFREKYFRYSQYLYSCIEEVKNANFEYDAYVTGSDMVWSWESRNYLDYYFLKFVSKNKRIAYAPSFGNTNFTEEMKSYYSEAVSGIKYCSCREINGCKYIASVTGNDCLLAVDPTMLLSEGEWNKIIEHRVSNRKNILMYIFGDIPKGYVKKVGGFESNGYTIRYIPQNHAQYKYEKKFGTDAFGPIDYLQAFHDASFVITNTYHGLMFSLIFRKPFIMIHRDRNEHWNIHEERMKSVLELIGLTNRYKEFDDDIQEEYLTLDYIDISKKLDEQINISREFLKQSLALASSGVE